MVVKNHKIIEATEDELFKYYVKRKLDGSYSFPYYLSKLRLCGVNMA